MRWRIPLIVSLALFVAVSCDQQPIEPVTEQVAEVPALNFINGPEYAGRVLRESTDDDCRGWCETTDPATDLYAFHFDAPNGWPCGGEAMTEWDAQMVDNGGWIQSMQASDQPIYIYSYTDLVNAYFAGPAAFCTFVENDWLYHGTHSIQFNASYTETANGWHGIEQMTANGFVTDQSDEQHRYREHQKWTSGGGWTHEDIAVN